MDIKIGNSSNNLGSGTGISAFPYGLKSLLGGSGITISDLGNEILLTASSSQATTASNLGTGTGVFAQLSGNDLQFKSLVGTGLTITSDANTIYLTANDPVGVFVHLTGDTMTGNLNTHSLLPTSSGIYNLGSESFPYSGLYIRDIFSNDIIRFSTVDFEVPIGNINGINTNYTLLHTPLTSTLEVYRDGVLLNQSGLSAGTEDYTLSANVFTLFTAPESGQSIIAKYGYANPSGVGFYGNLITTNIISGNIYDGTNLGAGEGVFAGTVITGNVGNLQFKSLVGTGLTITSDADTIYLTANDPVGVFVHLSGDTMSGNLIMAGANVIPSAAYTNSIGSLATPFAQMYAGTGNFHAVSGLSPISFLSDIHLESGINITTAGSGIATLGTSTNPFQQLWVTSISGVQLGVVYTGVSPISVISDSISIASGSASNNGYISSGDWATFNNKQASGTYNTTISSSGLGVSLINTGGPAVNQYLNSITGVGNVSITGPTNGLITISGTDIVITTYAKLDGTNQPFTGNLNISGVTTGEYKITSPGNAYSRYTRVSNSDQMNLYNQVMVPSAPNALGGDIIFTSGLYTYHVFSGNGTFDSTSAGTLSIDYLLVGGGGGGGSWSGGGGGGGGFLSGTLSTTAGSYSIIVGQGGGCPGATLRGDVGSGTTWNSLTAGGGGGGGCSNGTTPGLAGTATNGNGGGGAFGGAGGAGNGSGFPGGAGNANTGGVFGEGGGGGAGQSGLNAAPITNGGNGGNGKSWVDGVTYAGGGGGGIQAAGIRGSGGTGGGGLGATYPAVTDSTAGTNGLGGGGGAGGPGVIGSVGGKGIVKLRYLTPVTATQEANLVSSSGSSIPNEWGINTFGDTLGATHINGNALYFDVAGVNKVSVTSAGVISGTTFSGTTGAFTTGNIISLNASTSAIIPIGTNAPTGSSASGSTGQIAISGSFLFYAIGTNSWLRLSGTTF